MKQLFFLSAVILLICSCGNGLQDDDELAPAILKHVTIGVKPMDLSDLSPATKSEITITNTVKFAWSEGDMVGIYPDRGAQAYFEMSDFAGGDQAEFDGGGWALKAAHKYATYFPYEYDFSDPRAIPFRYADQIQNGIDNGSSSYEHLNEYQHLASGSEVPNNSGTCNYQLERAEAVVIFKLTLPVATTYNELTLKVSDGTQIVVATTLDISGEQYIIRPAETADMFSLGLTNVVTTMENQEVKFYAMMPPQDLSGKTLIFSANTVDGDCCQAEVAGKNMLNNHAYQYVATLTSDMGSLVEKFGSQTGNW
jgi:hypothetical protein